MPDNKVQRGGRYRHFAESLSEASREYRMLEQAPAMYELLKELEWFDERLHYSVCPIYKGMEQHSPDCRLAAVLKAVEGT